MSRRGSRTTNSSTKRTSASGGSDSSSGGESNDANEGGLAGALLSEDVMLIDKIYAKLHLRSLDVGSVRSSTSNTKILLIILIGEDPNTVASAYTCRQHHDDIPKEGLYRIVIRLFLVLLLYEKSKAHQRLDSSLLSRRSFSKDCVLWCW